MSRSAPASVAEDGEVVRLLRRGAMLIDVRTAAEFEAGRVEGALHLDVQQPDFADRIGRLDRGDEYVVYCASGNRATGAVEQMRDLGFGQVLNGGGFEDVAALVAAARE